MNKQKLSMTEITDTDREALYLSALDKWAKRVQMWHQTNKGRPPVFLDQNGNAHWVNRADRRKGGIR